MEEVLALVAGEGWPAPAEIEQVNQWLATRKGWEEDLEGYLLTRTTLSGAHITRADYALFVAVRPTVVSWKGKTLAARTNTLRWFDFVQHQSDASSAGIELHPILRTPPAFLAPAPKDASAAKSSVPTKQEQPTQAKPQSQPQPQSQSQAEPKAKEQPQKIEQPKEQKKENVQTEIGEKKEEAKPQQQQQQPPPQQQQQGKQQRQKGGQQQQQQGGEGKKGGANPPKSDAKPPAAAAAEGSDFSKLNIRVGKIVSAQKHPDADSLYHEQIDLGEEQPRSVVSGLVKHITLDEFIGKYVLVLTNLKPAKMRGVLSEGMVLCASTADSLEVLSPPEGTAVGERLTVEGENGAPDAQLNPKKKTWDKVRDGGEFTVSASGEVVYQGKPLLSSKGAVISAKKLVGAKIA